MNRLFLFGLVMGNVGLMMGIAAVISIMIGAGPPDPSVRAIGLFGLAIFAVAWFTIIQPFRYSDDGPRGDRDV